MGIHQSNTLTNVGRGALNQFVVPQIQAFSEGFVEEFVTITRGIKDIKLFLY